ncbi:glycosyltransferase [Shewanella sp. 0m-4]
MASFLFINNALSGTGGARVLLNLSESLIEKGHDVTILLDRVDNIDFEVNSEINIFHWSLFGIYRHHYSSNTLICESNKTVKTVKNMKVKSLFRFVRDSKFFLLYPFYCFSVWKFFHKQKFDLILNSNIYIGVERHWFLSKLPGKYFPFFHNSPEEVFSRKNFYSVLPLKFIFNGVSTVSVSEGIKTELIGLGIGNDDTNIVIYNSFDFNKIHSHSLIEPAEIRKPYILSVSTLTERKRVDRIIRAFSLNKRIVESFDLVIVGLGDKECELKVLAEELGILKNVHFLGFVSNPYPLMASASLLVLSSDSEGLPTVLIESLSLGTPVISTNCPTGPSEILNSWGNDVLVELLQDNDRLIEEVSSKMSRLLELNIEPEVVIKRSNLSRFDSVNVIKQWEKLI